MSYKEFYNKKVLPKLKKELGIKNVLACPKIERVVVHVGFGKHLKDSAHIENVKETIRNITGQQSTEVAAKKSISNFKVREGNIISAQTTLRGSKMYDFIERLIKITLPRVQDFRGIKKTKVDANGNLNIGFKDQIAFPESRLEDIHNPHGVQVTVVTTAKNHEDGIKFLKLLGFPFADK